MLTLVWDVDDVLNDLMYKWFTSEWLIAHPNCRVRYEQLTENPPHAILGVEKAVYLASLDKFRATPAALNLAPNPDVLFWLRQYGSRCRHIALTSRPLQSAPGVASWVMEHFSAWIRCFGVLPSRSDQGIPVYDRSKAEFLAWIQAGDILIDDTPENLRLAEAAGIRSLAFPQPWSGASFAISGLLQQLTLLVENS
jgi:hypothetical protein